MNLGCNSGCAHAQNPECECKCGGQYHGRGNAIATCAYLSATHSGDAKAKKDAEQRIHSGIETSTKRYADKRKELSANDPAAIHLAFLAIKGIGLTTSWLLEDPGPDSEQNLIMRLALELDNKLWETFKKPKSRVPETAIHRMRMHHILCTMIAEVAHYLRKTKEGLEELKESAVKATASKIAKLAVGNPHNTCEKRGNTAEQKKTTKKEERIITNVLTPLLRKIIEDIPDTAPLDQMLGATRILAIILCPAPEAHKLVWEECWHPLSDDVLHSIFDETIKDAMDQGIDMQSLMDDLHHTRDAKLKEYSSDLWMLAHTWQEIQQYTATTAKHT